MARSTPQEMRGRCAHRQRSEQVATEELRRFAAGFVRSVPTAVLPYPAMSMVSGEPASMVPLSILVLVGVPWNLFAVPVLLLLLGAILRALGADRGLCLHAEVFMVLAAVYLAVVVGAHVNGICLHARYRVPEERVAAATARTRADAKAAPPGDGSAN